MLSRQFSGFRGLLTCIAQTWSPTVRPVASETPVQVTRVDPTAYKPISLSQSLEEFEALLAHEKIRQNPEFFTVNQENFKSLVTFLKKYSKGLREDEPLQQQLHKLDFVVPSIENEESLRRLVVKVGTPGGSSGHAIVARCIQGLLREVGLSPHVVWDQAFELPERYLSYAERKRMEDALAEEKVKHIQAVRRGEELPENSPLRVEKAHHHSPNESARTTEGTTSVSQAATPMTRTASVVDSGTTESVDDEEDDPETMTQLCREIDENLRVLAMSPWVKVYGELRAEEEQKTVKDLTMFMNGVVPGYGAIIPRIWEGERDVEALLEELCQNSDRDASEKLLIHACVKQLCACHESLLDEFGQPDAKKPVARKKLVKVAAAFSYAELFWEQYGS